jgi:antitoxin VapB
LNRLPFANRAVIQFHMGGNIQEIPPGAPWKHLDEYILLVYTFIRELNMSQFAKLFRNGSSQAVRLPQEFRFQGDKVRIRRSGNSVVLEPLIADPEDWLAALKNIPADPDFMAQRNQPRTPKREIFE